MTWEGDDDPTLDVGAAAPAGAEPEPEPDATKVLPEGFTAVGKGSEEFAKGADADETTALGGRETEVLADRETAGAASASLGNAALIGLGVLGGIYLLYVIGWIVGGLRLRGTAQFLVSPVAYDVAMWLAAASPVIWFGAVYVLTRTSPLWVRFVWLAAGALLLIPWPFIMVGAIGR
nr:DNA polymerase III subunit gamma/tau [Microbacterium immunditiarum]